VAVANVRLAILGITGRPEMFISREEDGDALSMLSVVAFSWTERQE